MKTYFDFIKESNAIENIHRNPTKEEIAEFERFMALESISIDELKKFVSVYQPNAKLRDELGLNVRIAQYYPPEGGSHIVEKLNDILSLISPINSYLIHNAYESLHPFTDCNGRSGRMIWAWQERDFSLGFLHRFYYDSLRYSRQLFKS